MTVHCVTVKNCEKEGVISKPIIFSLYLLSTYSVDISHSSSHDTKGKHLAQDNRLHSFTAGNGEFFDLILGRVFIGQ